MSGTVNIARSLFADEAFKDQPYTEREAFMWMVMEASWKDRVKRVGVAVVELKRGQLAASVRFMADAWGWEKSTVDRFLKRLEKRDMIGTDIGTGINVITIRKYNDYQGRDTSSGTEKNEKRDSSGTAAGQTRTPDEIPELKREAKASPKKAPLGSRLGEDWFLPRAWGEWAMAEGVSQEIIRSEADRFKDYWISVAGAKGRKADWQATWRNWIRKHLDERTKVHGNPKGERRMQSWLAGASLPPGVDSWPDIDTSRPLLERR